MQTIVLKLSSKVFKTIPFEPFNFVGFEFWNGHTLNLDNTKSFKEQKYEEWKIIIQVKHLAEFQSVRFPIFSFSLSKYKSISPWTRNLYKCSIYKI